MLFSLSEGIIPILVNYSINYKEVGLNLDNIFLTMLIKLGLYFLLAILSKF